MKRALVVLVLLGIATGCVSPSWTDRDYQLKAGHSADQVVSSIATAQLGAKAGKEHKATQAYLSVLIGAAEKDALSVQGTFDSIQPPSKKADELRDELDVLLSDATAGLATLRIAVRRGDLDQLSVLAGSLQTTLEQLRALAERYA
ncbi:MAG: hypothetical protein JWM40_2701 [Frankiales bacterium]|nr:hypothetical protein [Frankiales bacterium]